MDAKTLPQATYQEIADDILAVAKSMCAQPNPPCDQCVQSVESVVGGLVLLCRWAPEGKRIGS